MAAANGGNGGNGNSNGNGNGNRHNNDNMNQEYLKGMSKALEKLSKVEQVLRMVNGIAAATNQYSTNMVDLIDEKTEDISEVSNSIRNELGIDRNDNNENRQGNNNGNNNNNWNMFPQCDDNGYDEQGRHWNIRVGNTQIVGSSQENNNNNNNDNNNGNNGNNGYGAAILRWAFGDSEERKRAKRERKRQQREEWRQQGILNGNNDNDANVGYTIRTNNQLIVNGQVVREYNQHENNENYQNNNDNEMASMANGNNNNNQDNNNNDDGSNNGNAPSGTTNKL